MQGAQLIRNDVRPSGCGSAPDVAPLQMPVGPPPCGAVCGGLGGTSHGIYRIGVWNDKKIIERKKNAGDDACLRGVIRSSSLRKWLARLHRICIDWQNQYVQCRNQFKLTACNMITFEKIVVLYFTFTDATAH